MQNNALISIIVPIYNVEKYLGECIESIINQTYGNIEVICIDDGSTDGSLNVLKEYADKDRRIKVFTQENKGPSFARNKGLDECSGEYIMFVDSDDWIDLNTCEVSLKAAVENHADVVMYHYVREYGNKSLPRLLFPGDRIFDEDEVACLLHRRMVGIVGEELAYPERADSLCPNCMKLYKAEIIQKNNIRFYDMSKIGTYEDGIFNLNVFKYVKKAAYLCLPLYHYRKTNLNSITSRPKQNLKQQRDHLHQYLENYIQKNNLGQQYKKGLSNRIALELLGLGMSIIGSKEKPYKEIKKLLKEEKYHRAFKQLEIKYLPFHWRIFYWCARERISFGVYALLRCIRWMNRKRKECKK